MADRKHRSKRKPAARAGSRGGRARTLARADLEPGDGKIWLYGVHPVHAALGNPRRQIVRLLATRSTAESLPAGAPAPEIVERHEIDALLPEGAVHQGLAALASPLGQPTLKDVLKNAPETATLVGGPLAITAVYLINYRRRDGSSGARRE